jgi:D-alanine-D-alanine ligase
MKFAIVFGGISFEHEISIVSAIVLKDVLKKELEFIFVDKNREFYLVDEKNMKSKFFSLGDYKKSEKLTLKNGGFYKKTLLGEKKIQIDTIINLVHGGDGEDGKLAGMFDFFSVNFIGPRVEASVLSFNKLYTKLYANEIGVKTLDYEVLRDREYKLKKLNFPVIVKPSRLGSSIGVSIVKDESELEYALDVAYEFDSEIVVEPFIEGVKEYNLAGALTKDGYIFSIVEEPEKKEFLDFEKKYMDFSRTRQVLKADIDEELEKSLKENFKKIYSKLFQGAIIRCDFFVVDKEVVLNEINPIPGSYANYLFSDFNKVVDEVAKNLPKQQKIDIDYKYINSIVKAKGK